MVEESASHTSTELLLRFACSCASAAPVVDDPWVPIAKQGKLNDGTKERILNLLHDAPRTVSQLARELGLAIPSVHRQVTELLASELVREVDLAAGRRSPVERYYRPNFPVVRAADRQALHPLLEDLADEIAAAFRTRLPALVAALDGPPRTAGEPLDADILPHYLYATAVRRARERLESADALPSWPQHRDGSRWVWWAEEAPAMPTRESEGRVPDTPE